MTTGAPWIEISFQQGGDIRHVYSAEEAARLIAEGELTPTTQLTAYTRNGPSLVLAGSLSQLVFAPPEGEAEADDGSDGKAETTAVSPPAAPAAIVRDSRATPSPWAIAPGLEAVTVPLTLPAQREPAAGSPPPRPVPPPAAPRPLQPPFAGSIIFQAMRRYGELDGRGSRAEYWMFLLLAMLVLVLLSVLTPAFGDALGELLLVVTMLALAGPAITATVRRLHDQNLSGWVALVGLIPILGAIALLLILMIEGTRGRNKYGDPPPV